MNLFKHFQSTCYSINVTGIGYETAKWIAMMGARVIIACRSEERAKKVSLTSPTTRAPINPTDCYLENNKFKV